jgi:hypothetical protein
VLLDEPTPLTPLEPNTRFSPAPARRPISLPASTSPESCAIFHLAATDPGDLQEYTEFAILFQCAMWRATTANSISFSKPKARPPLPEWPASFTAWTSRPSPPLSLHPRHLFLRTNILRAPSFRICTTRRLLPAQTHRVSSRPSTENPYASEERANADPPRVRKLHQNKELLRLMESAISSADANLILRRSL